ncbi:MAG TPA: hypothetical protein VN279_01175 [Rhodocyclaceae bacterium]|nr:hypothetical protein [Rhodocyclaceae bacterium]
MRLESVSIILAIALASGIAYAWWVARARRRREPDLRRDGVLGKATVTGVVPAGDGSVRVEYRFRHPFTGETYVRAGRLPAAAAPREGEQVEIVYADQAPELSRLRAEIEGG